MNSTDISNILVFINRNIQKNRDLLIELDQKTGDGDLGVSMSKGFDSVTRHVATLKENDIGKVLLSISMIFNENAPSTMGTILSLFLTSAGKSLVGKSEASLCDLAQAFRSGTDKITEKTGSKAGEKTILDALLPAVAALEDHSSSTFEDAFRCAARAAKDGSASTINMKAVHGRASYYGEASIGNIDGGSVVGSLLFESILGYIETRQKGEA